MSYFNRNRISQVIKVSATETDAGEFLATHTPFKQLYLYQSGVDTDVNKEIGIKVGEDDFLNNYFLGDMISHQVVIVEGDQGTGKSHFIRWLKEKYITKIDRSKEAVLFIARFQNTLQDVLEQILESDIIDKQFRVEELKKLKEAKQNLSGTNLKNQIGNQFGVIVKNYLDTPNQNVSFNKVQLRKLYNFLSDLTVRAYLEEKGGPIDRIKSRLSSDNTTRIHDEDPKFNIEDFKEINIDFCNRLKNANAAKDTISFAEDLRDDNNLKTTLVLFLNAHLETVVEFCTKLRVSDIRAMFLKIREKLKEGGKNLTLFMEDITSMVGIDRALLEAIITPHTGEEEHKKFCRMKSIIGITSSNYIQLPHNIKERVTYRIILREESFTSEEAKEMCGRYFNAIRLTSDEINNWCNDGAKESSLPIADALSDTEWSSFATQNNLMFSLFPLNDKAVLNLYGALKEKTPRRFIFDVVFKISNRFEQEGQFPPSVNEFSNIGLQVPNWKDAKGHSFENKIAEKYHNKFEQIISLLRLWGDGTSIKEKREGKETVGGLSKEVFDSFKLPFVNIGDDVQVTPEPTSKTGLVEQPERPPALEGKKKFDHITSELEKWVGGEKLYAFENLREDIVAFILNNIDWQSENIPKEFVISIITTNRISIEGQTGATSEGYVVKRNRKSRNALLGFAAWRHLGNRSWVFEGSLEFIYYVYSWFSSIKQDIISAVKFPNKLTSDDLKVWDSVKECMLIEIYLKLIGNDFGVTNNVDNIAEEVYLRIFKKDSPSILIDGEGRSQKWTDMQEFFSRNPSTNTLINNCHSLMLNAYNRIQTKIGDKTDVYFIDVVHIIERIDNLIGNKLIFPKRKLVTDSGEFCWYWTDVLMKRIEDRIEKALKDEMEMYGEIIKRIKEICNNEINKDKAKMLFSKMKEFLNYLNQNNIPYYGNQFRDIVDDPNVHNSFMTIVTKLMNLLEEKDYLKRLLKISSSINKDMNQYLQLFNNFDSLLNKLNEEYDEKLEKMEKEGGSRNIEKVMTDIKSILDDISNKIKSVGIANA